MLLIEGMTSPALQLGHAGEGVEIVLLYLFGSAVTMLQLGHAGEGVEILMASQNQFLQKPASIGPRR